MSNIIHLEDELLQITGATKVVSTTQLQAIIEIGEKCIIITGEGIEVKKLNLEQQEVCLEGNFTNIKLSSSSKKIPFLKRIFR